MVIVLDSLLSPDKLSKLADDKEDISSTADRLFVQFFNEVLHENYGFKKPLKLVGRVNDTLVVKVSRQKILDRVLLTFKKYGIGIKQIVIEKKKRKIENRESHYNIIKVHLHFPPVTLDNASCTSVGSSQQQHHK